MVLTGRGGLQLGGVISVRARCGVSAATDARRLGTTSKV